MFTFSFQHFLKLRTTPIALDELLEILNLQGLEVKKVVPWEGDTAITIEVKANRAFCLSYLGLLREVAAFKNEPEPKLLEDLPELEFDNTQFPLPITIEAKSGCPAFGAVIIKNINNKISTPQGIVEALLAVGVNTVNPVVDILNFIMLETGQPFHCYDLDKIKNGLVVRVNKHLKNIRTLNDSEVTLPRGPVVIADEKEILAVAGIVGTNIAAVTENTNNVLIECASFNATAIRIAARGLKISTPSAFRFERGVDATQIKMLLARCAQTIQHIVGGHIVQPAYSFGKEERKPVRIILSAKKVNHTLGLNLTTQEIIQCLRQYYFAAENTKRGIEIIVPAYRLDIKAEIDAIGEIARIYGYHRIPATLPHLPLSFTPNPLREKSNRLRDVLVGLGFYEVMTYSFIPQDALSVLNIPAEHPLANQVMLQNPLSQDYALMRPTLAYSLMQTAAYNYSIGNKNLAIFEIGKTYFPNPASDTGHKEYDVLGLLFSGVHIERGFGLVKDLSYGFYDLSDFLNVMLSELGLKYTLRAKAVPFLKEEASFEIVVEGKPIGFCGLVTPAIWQKIPNGKLILTDAFYAELELDKLHEGRKSIGARIIFPAVVREYNFYVDKTLPAANILAPIKASDTLIQSVQLKDIYEGKGMEPGKKAVLITVKYVHPDKTLTAEEVVKIEERFLMQLNQQGIQLGQ